MVWNWQSVKGQLPVEEQRDDELWLVLDDEHQLVQQAQLVANSWPSLQQQIESLRLYIGFNGDKGTKPYAVVQWLEPEGSRLERRWVFGRAMQRLKTLVQFRTLTLMTSQRPDAEQQRVFGEDVYSSWLNPRSGRFPYEEIRGLYLDGVEAAWHDQAELRFHRRRLYADWVNENPDELTSLAIGERLRTFAKQHKCHFGELDTEHLAREGMNLLLAVGQASERSPSRCFVLSHNYDGSRPPLMLVGKGITFDTGGINVKPFTGHVNAMKNDMGGAALMSQLFMSLVEAGFPQPLVLVIPSCENLVAEKAMKPGTVVRSHKGHEVMIEHTDAEGRLILADAISYGHSRFTPRLTLVGATLTTAALRQFTNFWTPVHFANQAFQQALTQAAGRYGEAFTFWDKFLPFVKANRAQMGDWTNMGRMPSHASVGGGSNVAAHFLLQFASQPMIHFDIFASAWNWSGDYPGSSFGATGAPFNSLFHLLKQAPKDLWGYQSRPVQ
jgi:leucyl aminopeptidase